MLQKLPITLSELNSPIIPNVLKHVHVKHVTKCEGSVMYNV